MIYECNATQINVEYFYLNLATKNSHGKLRKFAFFLTHLVCPLFVRRREGSKRRATALSAPKVVYGRQFMATVCTKKQRKAGAITQNKK